MMIMVERPDNNEQPSNENKNKKKENKRINELESRLEDLLAHIKKIEADEAHWKNEYYRVFADTKNLRKKLEEENLEARKYLVEGLIEKIIPTLDAFNAALNGEQTDPAIKNYLTGFQYVYKQLLSQLESEGMSVIQPKIGDKFDHSSMNAIETEESEDEENIITRVYTNGYKIHNRLIRPANVCTTIHPKKEETQSETETDA